MLRPRYATCEQLVDEVRAVERVCLAVNQSNTFETTAVQKLEDILLTTCSEKEIFDNKLRKSI